jgi:DNA-binding transcriptional regulator GbsR (MarR family)
MSDLKINKSQLELIEKIGVVHERSGMQPAAARILALLVISDRTELTFDEIQQTLGISKSSASVAINLLVTMNRIEYITKVGDRKRYFRSKLINWKEDMKRKMEGMTEMNILFKEVLAQRPKSSKEFNNTLGEIIDFMEFFQKEVPVIFKKWELKNKS